MLLAKETVDIYNKLHEAVLVLEPEDDGRNAAVASALEILFEVLEFLRSNLDALAEEDILSYDGSYDED